MTAIQTNNKQLIKKSSKILVHFLIGTPGSGKSTFAQLLSKLGDYEVISTDDIRKELYGDAKIQGEWLKIESIAIERICNSLKLNKGIIYDATNFKRCFRIDFLTKVKTRLVELDLPQPDWIGWYLQTPLKTCMKWNQQRQRQVPLETIKTMDEQLQKFPPVSGEGFAVVEKVNVSLAKFSENQIKQKIAQIPRQIINFQNRYAQITTHRYSNLIDFERLMHLISLIVKYPGIGSLHLSHPKLLQSIFGYVPEFTSSGEEITAMMAKLRGTVYADENAISADLEWLTSIGFFNHQLKVEINCGLSQQQLTTNAIHSYSDEDVFKRLIGTIRFIIRYPFLNKIDGSSLQTLIQALAREGIICNSESERDKIRKDIEKVLKPYKILAEFPMRNGYFAGTAIFSKLELIKLFDIIQSQAKVLDDPQVWEIYQSFQKRLLQTHITENTDNIYPVRAIANNSMVDAKHLHPSALVKDISELETAIAEGKLLELQRLKGVGRYPGDEKHFFLAYPLQMVFSNFAWYLGYECMSGETSGLLRFERLDRLFLGNMQSQQRSREEQAKILKKLHKLLNAGAGMYLGNSVSEQKLFLSSDKQKQKQVCVTVELWFDDNIYHFITEGTKRFAQIKMSPPIQKTTSNLPKSFTFTFYLIQFVK